MSRSFDGPLSVPAGLPVLSAGRHRSPRSGACFMEMASYLAGERWSDHPRCTHPLLASAARAVNDRTTDAARSRLAVLVPSVVGLTSDDPRLGPRLVRAAAARALPVAAEPRQRVLAVGVLTCDRVLAELDGRDPASWEVETQEALGGAPGARAWAQRFTAEQRGSSLVRRRVFDRETAPRLLFLAASAIGEAVVPDADDRLRALLGELVEMTRAHARPAPQTGVVAPGASEPVQRQRWDDVVRLTAARR